MNWVFTVLVVGEHHTRLYRVHQAEPDAERAEHRAATRFVADELGPVLLTRTVLYPPVTLFH